MTIRGLVRPHPSLAVAERQIAADRVTGDILYSCANESCMTVLIGDVSGKGPAAAAVAERIRAIVQASGLVNPPANPLALLNRWLLSQQSDRERFVSAALAVIEPAAEQITVCSAGHPPPLLIRRGEVEVIEAGGFVLGVCPDLELAPATRPFGPGDALLLFTDAVLDARSPGGDRLEEEGLLALVRKHRDREPEELIAALLEDVYRSWRVSDDLTLCVVRHLMAAPANVGGSKT